MTEDDPGARLAEAERLTAAVRRRSRWTIWSYVLIGTAGFGLAPLFAHPERRLLFWLGIAVCLAVLGAHQAFVRRRPVEPRSYQARSATFTRLWFGVWLIIVLVGSAYFRGELAFWVPAGAVTALIMYAGAFLEYREVRR